MGQWEKDPSTRAVRERELVEPADKERAPQARNVRRAAEDAQ